MAHLRHALAIALVLATAPTNGTGAQAQTPEVRLLKAARAALRIGLVEPFCGPFYLIDRKQVAEVQAAVKRDAIERFGQEAFAAAVQDVKPEFAAEMRAGAAIWCPKQREAYRKLGLPGLIGGNLR